MKLCSHMTNTDKLLNCTVGFWWLWPAGTGYQRFALQTGTSGKVRCVLEAFLRKDLSASYTALGLLRRAITLLAADEVNGTSW